MIVVDSLGHMMSDKSLDELHRFAARLKLKPEWFQDNKDHPHYDLCKWDFNLGKYVVSQNKINEAIKLGAHYIDVKTPEGRKELFGYLEKFKLVG